MKWLKRIAITLAVLCTLGVLLATAALLYTLNFIATPVVNDPSTPILAHPESPKPQSLQTPPWAIRAAQDQQSAISVAQFLQPAQRFGPWTRWWWPGNLVETAELQREMQMFADVGLAGVEIQPFAISVSESDTGSAAWAQSGWDSPKFYRNLHTVLDAALALDLEVDLNNGSGWPTGGPHVSLQDGMRQLLHSELFVTGPRKLSTALPAPQIPVAAFAAGTVGMLGDIPMQTFAVDTRELVAVVAAKVIDNQRTWEPWDFLDQVVLDPQSRQVITQYVSEGELQWEVPLGDWAITALWQMPGGELVSGGYAHAQPGYVVDHLDAQRMRANQNYLFRQETGLARYFGKPLRAIFNDSLEFRQERHWAIGQLEEFEQRMGYDPRPWMAALIEPGKDQMPFHAINVPTLPAYDLGPNALRFLEDWDRVISDLFRERYFQSVKRWTEERALAHRLQAYGGPMDVLRGAAESDIPEAEQLYAGGSEMFLKAVSSGAHIANKPIISAESFIFMGRAFMTTPVKIKALADKAFAAGINQIVYHGTSYQIADHPVRGYPENTGWYPWQLGMISTDYSENWPYWEHARELNQYIARSQYLLRKGEPETDVLLFYPGLGFPQGYGNPEEPFDQGAFPGEELLQEQPEGQEAKQKNGAVSKLTDRGAENMRGLWRAMRDIERNGLTWAWINEDALLSASYKNGIFQAGGLRASSLRIHDIEAMSPDVAEHIVAMSAAGLPVQVSGIVPQRQRGLAGSDEGDQRVINAITAITNRMEGPAVSLSGAALLEQTTRFQHASVKTLRRRLDGGAMLQFFSNPSDKNITVEVNIPEGFTGAYWLNAWDGSLRTAVRNDNGYSQLKLSPYGSIFLWLRTGGTRNSAIENVNEAGVEALSPKPEKKLVASSTLSGWRLQVPAANYSQTESALGDWLNIAELWDSEETGDYSTTFSLTAEQINAINEGGDLIVELGHLFGAAKVTLNSQPAGTALVPPYRISLNSAVQVGDNVLNVYLTPPRKNSLIEAIVSQAPGWNAPDLIGTRARVSAGLIGPVQLKWYCHVCVVR